MDSDIFAFGNPGPPHRVQRTEHLCKHLANGQDLIPANSAIDPLHREPRSLLLAVLMHLGLQLSAEEHRSSRS